MIVTPFLAGSFDLIAGEFLASNRKTKTNVESLAGASVLSPGFRPGFDPRADHPERPALMKWRQIESTKTTRKWDLLRHLAVAHFHLAQRLDASSQSFSSSTVFQWLVQAKLSLIAFNRFASWQTTIPCEDERRRETRRIGMPLNS
jgi:hypothetical protein